MDLEQSRRIRMNEDKEEEMSKSNVDVIKEIFRARAKLIDAGIAFDDLKLSNLVDAGAFFEAQKIMNGHLEEAIILVAERLEDEPRNERAKAAAKDGKTVGGSCLCNGCEARSCPMHPF